VRFIKQLWIIFLSNKFFIAVIYNKHWNGVHPIKKSEPLLKSLSFSVGVDYGNVVTMSP